MATYSKVELSVLTDGVPLKITPTGTAGETIHTAHATAQDEIWLWACNTASASRKLTVEFGGVAVDQNIVVNIPAETTVLVVPGWVLTNSKVMAAFASVADVINVVGFVNRITP